MREILTNPLPTVDENLERVKHIVAGPLYSHLSREHVAVLDELIEKAHSCGCLYAASMVLQEYTRKPERRSPPQILLDIKTTNQKIIAQIVPAEGSDTTAA